MQGSLPVALAAIIIGRDVLLVTGACVDRCRRVSSLSQLLRAHSEYVPASAMPCIRWLPVAVHDACLVAREVRCSCADRLEKSGLG